MSDSPDCPSSIDTFVLAGQSNMEGRARLDAVEPSNPRLWLFSSAGQWELAREPLHRIWESCTPVHQTLQRPQLTGDDRRMTDAELADREAAINPHRVGPGWSFGRELVAAMERPIGLIPAAHGGTSLEQWSHTHKSRGGESLYGAMLERIDRAGGTLRGILWYQGESDAMTHATAESYGQRFEDWIAAVRNDLQQPDLPIMVVQLGRWTEGTAHDGMWNMVRHAQYRLPDRVLHTAVTSAIDLGLNDPIHLNTRAQRRLGRRLARLALSLCYGRDVPRGPRLEQVDAESQTWRGATRGLVHLRFHGVTGGIQPSDHLAGFTCVGSDGSTPTDNRVFHAGVDSANHSVLHLELHRPLNPGESIAYGQGCNPYCNAVDDADMPICAFTRPD